MHDIGSVVLQDGLCSKDIQGVPLVFNSNDLIVGKNSTAVLTKGNREVLACKAWD